MATRPLNHAETRCKSVLYVEDDESAREAIASVLDLEGYRVTTAATTAEALRALASDRFDLLMTDYELPDGDGATLVMKGRACGALRQTPAIMVTSMPNAKPVRGVPVVKKPVTPAELLTIVRVAIGIRA